MNMRDAMMMWGEKNNIEVSQIENKTIDGKQVPAVLYYLGI